MVQEFLSWLRYFTWDPIKFSDPENMINVLATKGRKLVVIIDPHIKRDNGYSVHREATANGYYVKNKDRNDFEGILLTQFLMYNVAVIF